MTHRQRSRARIALLAFCALLLAQWTLVTHACPVIAAVGQALEWQALAAEEAVSDCHGQPPADGTCIKHCSGDDQANGAAATPAAAAPPASAGLRVTAAPARGAVTALSAATHADATAPPLIILYCVLLA